MFSSLFGTDWEFIKTADLICAQNPATKSPVAVESPLQLFAGADTKKNNNDNNNQIIK